MGKPTIPSFSSYTMCNCCSREWCSNGRPIRSKDDINCCCRCFYPLCTVASVDGCGTSVALAFVAGFWYTLFCWEPRCDEELLANALVEWPARQPERVIIIQQAPAAPIVQQASVPGPIL